MIRPGFVLLSIGLVGYYLQAVGAALFQLYGNNLNMYGGFIGGIPVDVDKVLHGAEDTTRNAKEGIPIRINEDGFGKGSHFARFGVRGFDFLTVDILDVDILPNVIGNLDGGVVDRVIHDCLCSGGGFAHGAIYPNGVIVDKSNGVGVFGVFHNVFLSLRV